MEYAIELYFDKKSEEKLIELWRQLHDNNLSSHMYLSGGKPHIALTVFNSKVDDNILKNLVREFAFNRKKFKLLFSSLGMFASDEGVSFISPKVTIDLLQFHSDLYDIIRKYNIDSYVWEYYRPEFWIPHCTMTIGTSKENQLKGLDLISKNFKPFEVNVEKIALIDFYPVHHIEEVELKCI